ncbi:zonular occludens toxin domain-containing protein [Aeromonas sp. 5HA1]|uniref:zonular occludens toxin family protein n=1 Tax=Aeromonas sp. 5HA1 TaxID=2699197 RepID=UPI0023DDD9FF|nr:zonular occludens toxin domain-containing protein [Aeromonas sp. 5HA1]MDF2401287.1 zona occludens toxin [Aeromonas sp. 5HA1]MDF2401297.1 zona occludens toxin [Aeromonas sp. 5HA1]
MSIKIHHGAPGSYKSSGAIHTDVIPAIKAGRHIVTNVRGFTAERCREVLGKAVPDDFQVTYIETESQEGRDHFARFYHWAPKGVFFLVDEVQRIFPPSWRQTDLDRLDYPGGPDVAKNDGRPETIDVAFDMHRHHNWDFVFTTPNIKKVHQVIRAAAETAIRHTNMAILGIGGRYKTVLHLSDNSGSSMSDVLQAKPFNKVPKYVFELYDSTATGKVSDTIAGSSVLRDPKILLFLAVWGLCIFFGFIKPEYIDAPAKAAQAAANTSSVPGAVDGASADGVRPGGTPAASPGGVLSVGPFAGYRLIISCHVLVKNDRGSYRVDYCFSLRKGDEVQPLYSDDWPDELASVDAMSACHAVVKYQGKPVDVYCDPDGDTLRRKYNAALFAGTKGDSEPNDDRT